MEKETKLSRRGFLKGSMFAFGAVAFLSKMVGTAFADMVDPLKVPMAKTLKYVADAAAAKKAGTIDAKYKDGQHCQVCTFYKGLGQADFLCLYIGLAKNLYGIFFQGYIACKIP